MFGNSVILGICLTLSSACVRQGDRVDLGSLQIWATISFVRAKGGEWVSKF